MGCEPNASTHTRLDAIQQFTSSDRGDWTYLAFGDRGPQGHLAVSAQNTDEHLAALVVDPGLKASQALLVIHELNVARTSLTDAGVLHIGEFSNLVRLDASRTHITGTSLDAISHLQWLRELDLSDTNLTDAALSTLSQLPRLSRLRLVDVPLTDSSTDSLAALSHVDVELYSSKMSEAARETIARQLPHVRWIHYDSH